jgi:hypothetical protein
MWRIEGSKINDDLYINLGTRLFNVSLWARISYMKCVKKLDKFGIPKKVVT